MKVGVTGASGFVGGALVKHLSANIAGCSVLAISRGPVYDFKKNGERLETLKVRDYSDTGLYEKNFEGLDVLVHVAAKVHDMSEKHSNVLEAYREANCSNTLKLADAASRMGVKRFVFLSTVKVSGEFSQHGKALTELSDNEFKDAYATSKFEAERALMNDFSSLMDIVVIRPPLIYGPGVKANFNTMMVWLVRKIPLPLGSIQNKRSLVSIDNLIDFIVVCSEHPAAANEVFMVSDCQDLSIRDILVKLGGALGYSAKLIAVPELFLRVLSKVLGKQEVVNRLCNSLVVNCDKAKELLDWSPPFSLDEGFKKTAEHFLSSDVK